jgi:hypothetical protein
MQAKIQIKLFSSYFTVFAVCKCDISKKEGYLQNRDRIRISTKLDLFIPEAENKKRNLLFLNKK